MSDTMQAIETTAERKPPTLADIVREKTDDGRLIIDFFIDVMVDRIDGAELCHRIDAAKQLEKHRSRAAAEFLEKYRGVPCGHSLRRSPGQADTCSDSDAAGRVNAPAPFTQDLLTVLSAVDENLMTMLVRAQTIDGGTVIDFLDDVMKDRIDGFKPHHRIAAAKELIVHIVRDEAPEPENPTPEPPAHPEPVEGPLLSTAEVPAHPEPVEGPLPSTAEVPAHPEPVEGPLPSTAEVPAHPEPVEGPLPSTAEVPAHPEPVEGPLPSTTEGPQLDTNNSKLKTLLPGRSPPS